MVYGGLRARSSECGRPVSRRFRRGGYARRSGSEWNHAGRLPLGRTGPFVGPGSRALAGVPRQARATGGEFQDNFQKLHIDAAHMELARVYYVLGRIEEGDREMRSVKPGME